MNVYQGRGVERCEVIRDRKRIEIYKGLALKSEYPPRQSDKAEPATAKNEVESHDPVEDEPTQVNPDIPVAVPTTQRKLVDYNRGNLFLPDTPKETAKTPEPQTPPPPKAASTDRRSERKPANDAVKSDADRLLDVWADKYPYEMRHREQVIDMAIYAGLFISVSGREAKWKEILPSLIRWEDEGKITAWLGGMYQLT